MHDGDIVGTGAKTRPASVSRGPAGFGARLRFVFENLSRDVHDQGQYRRSGQNPLPSPAAQARAGCRRESLQGPRARHVARSARSFARSGVSLDRATGLRSLHRVVQKTGNGRHVAARRRGAGCQSGVGLRHRDLAARLPAILAPIQARPERDGASTGIAIRRRTIAWPTPSCSTPSRSPDSSSSSASPNQRRS